MFSSRSFVVSGLTLKSLIRFEFIFVYSVRKWSSFVLLHVAVQFSQHHLWKRLSSTYCMFLPHLSYISGPESMGLLLGSPFYSIELDLFLHFAELMLSHFLFMHLICFSQATYPGFGFSPISRKFWKETNSIPTPLSRGLASSQTSFGRFPFLSTQRSQMSMVNLFLQQTCTGLSQLLVSTVIS